MKPIGKEKISDDLIKSLSAECSLTPLASSLLISRGLLTKEAVRIFLYGTTDDLTDPYLYSGCGEIADRLRSAAEQRKKIVIYGDYDCDGIGATAIYYLSLRAHGADVSYYIPSRKEEGYGLNLGAIEKIKQEYNPDILLTADCGITSLTEINRAKELGMFVLVTDHHTPGDCLPDCPILDPCLNPELTPLCAAGVALFVIAAAFGKEEAMQYTDICTVSTVADIVPLLKDNRLLVQAGLKKIHSGRCRPGLKTLIQKSNIDIADLTVGDISFRIGPRLNAAGRLSTAIDSLRLLIDDDPSTLLLLTEKLILQNTERQQISSEIFAQAMEQLRGYDFGKYRLIMLCGEWSEGVVGIVCSKLTEFFHLPSILLCKQPSGKLCGSARSIPGVNLYELLSHNAEKLLSYGGHAMAAGLSLASTDFEEERSALNEYLISAVPESVFEREISYDALLSVKDIGKPLYRELQLFEPFGMGNPKPFFFDESPNYVFKRGSEKFPLIRAKAGIGEAVSFDGLSKLALLSNPHSFIYTVDRNIFNGSETAQFNIKNFFFGDYELPLSLCWENYCRCFFRREGGATPIGGKRDAPVLYICFLPSTVRALLANQPDIPVYCQTMTSMEMRDSVVLSPDKDFPFTFFGKAVFCDWVLPTLQTALDAYMTVDGSDAVRPECEIDLTLLRDVFIYYYRHPINGKFHSYAEIYEKSEKNIPSDRVFIAASYILQELNLLQIDESGRLTVVNKKVEPNRSTLYNFLRGTLWTSC